MTKLDDKGQSKKTTACRRMRLAFVVHFALSLSLAPCALSIELAAQQLLDRVVARVNGSAILQSDLQAAIGLGLVESKQDPVQGVIERQLQLAEVARFPPPEPSAAAIDAELVRLKTRGGDRLRSLMTSTGLNEDRLREIARESLRIQAYLDQRFGTTVPVSEDQALQYYRDHPEEFARNGVTPPFEEVAALARQRASVERRRVTIDQWLRDLRRRADVVVSAFNAQGSTPKAQ